MKYSHKIPQADITLVLPGYKGEYGWPTFGDFKQFLPDHYQYHRGDWLTWDNNNKSSVILSWHSRQVSIEAQERWLAESNEVSRRIALEEKQRAEREEEERLLRVAKREEEVSRRARADNIHADQMDANKRKLEAEQLKRTDKLVDESVLLVSEISGRIPMLLKILARLPAERMREVDIEILLFNLERLKKAAFPGPVVEIGTIE